MVQPPEEQPPVLPSVTPPDPEKPKFSQRVQRVLYALFSPETRTGRIMRPVLRWLAAVTGLFALGLVVGYLFAAWAVTGLDTEVYRVPLIIHRATYGFAVAVVLAGAAISGLLVRERLDHLDLIAVLKTRE